MVQTKIAIIALLAIIHLSRIPGELYAVSASSPWWTHFTYPFFHGSTAHLLCNAYAIWFCLQRLTARSLVVVYLITVAASFTLPSPTPVIGASGVIFSIIGINLASAPTRNNLIYIAVLLGIGFAIPHISGITHLTCLLAGFLSSVIYKNIIRFRNDYHR